MENKPTERKKISLIVKFGVLVFVAVLISGMFQDPVSFGDLSWLGYPEGFAILAILLGSFIILFSRKKRP